MNTMCLFFLAKTHNKSIVSTAPHFSCGVVHWVEQLAPSYIGNFSRLHANEGQPSGTIYFCVHAILHALCGILINQALFVLIFSFKYLLCTFYYKIFISVININKLVL